MKQIIIIYEFQSMNTYKIAQFKDMIRKYGKFAFITDNSCIIWTNSATAVSVRDYLMTGLDLGDKLFVSETYAPAAWTTNIPKEVSDYIINNLKSK